MTRVRQSVLLLVVLLIATVLGAACAPAAAPTSTPTKAPAAATPTAAPKVEPTKPAAVAATPTVAPAATTATKPTGKAIKVGYIVPLTGRVAGYGVRQKIAVQLAVDDINNSGGVNGSPIELVIADDASDPKQTVTMVRRLATDDKVAAILGPMTTATYEVAAPLANELQLPLATATSTKEGITDQNRPWVFRFHILDKLAIPKGIEGYKKLYPNVKKVVITGDVKESVSENIIKNLYPKFLKEAGIDVIDTVPFETGTTDFSAIVTKIKSLNPQGVVHSSLTNEDVGMAKELQRQAVGVPVMISLQGWGGPDVILAGSAMEGFVAGGTFDEDITEPKGRAYVDRYVKIAEADPAVGKPAYAGSWTHAFDALTVIADVMRKGQVNGDMDLQKARTAIRDGISNVKGFKGVAGEISMQPNGDMIATPLPFVAKSGKWILIK